MALRITKPLLYAVLIIAGAAKPSLAITYQWPIARSLDVTIQTWNQAVYTLEMGVVVINDPTISQSSSVAEVIGRAGHSCPGNICYWGEYHKHYSASNSPPTSFLARRSMVQGDENFAQVAGRLSQEWGSGTISLVHTGTTTWGGECAGTALGPKVNASEVAWDAFLPTLWNGGADSVAGSCLGTPPANQWCALTQPSITLDFGRSVITDASTIRASASTQVECSTGMKYTLRLRDQDTIPLANGMKAALTADSKALGATLNGDAGPNTVSLGATLTGVPKAGSLSGNGVLFVSYP